MTVDMATVPSHRPGLAHPPLAAPSAPDRALEASYAHCRRLARRASKSFSLAAMLLPPALVDELLAGVAMDLSIDRYETWSDLQLYCYRVASVVGLLVMHIVGHAPGAESY